MKMSNVELINVTERMYEMIQAGQEMSTRNVNQSYLEYLMAQAIKDATGLDISEDETTSIETCRGD